MNVELKEFYQSLCKYKFFDFYKFDYKRNTYDKTTQWVFYDKDNTLNILIFEQTQSKEVHNYSMIDTIKREWFVIKESDNFLYKNISDIFDFIKENEEFIRKMNMNYLNNINHVNYINEFLHKNISKDYKYVVWKFENITKTNEYIKIYIDLFLDNDDKNIKILKKSKGKKEIEEYYNINELLEYLKKICKTYKKNNIDKKFEELNNNFSVLNTTDDIDTPTIVINVENNEIISKKEISQTYKNLFIKKPLINRLSIQTGKYKYELLKENFEKLYN